MATTQKRRPASSTSNPARAATVAAVAVAALLAVLLAALARTRPAQGQGHSTSSLAATATVLPATLDTTVGDNGLIGGTHRTLLVGNDLRDGNGREYALLQFDVSSIPPNALVQGVTLKVRGSYSRSPYDGHVVSVAVYPASGPWDETTVRQPGPGYDTARQLGVWPMPSSDDGTLRWHQLSSEALRALVQGWVNGSTPNYGLALVAEGLPDSVDAERGVLCEGLSSGLVRRSQQ
ncbi:MAG: DNRLRE domain-containing protein [Ardenticatenia bacterium]|nr:DNRLRE domain-containing protein [Ardenticatenia bacterium]